jgi:hypothetical protein
MAPATRRDAVRSSDSHFVKCSGLRWICVMVLTKVSWANRVWALPVLTALAPSERYYADKPRTHKKVTDWARQLLLQLKRWVPQRQLIAVGDSTGPPGGYAVIELFSALQGRVSLISRLRLDAALYEPAPVRATGQVGRKRLKGKRLATLAQLAGAGALAWQWLEVVDWYGGQPQRVEYATGTAVWYHSGKPPVPVRWVVVRLNGKLTGLVSNDSTLLAEQIISYFVRRWSMETTFALVRAHLGVETQRQWSTLAIARNYTYFDELVFVGYSDC